MVALRPRATTCLLCCSILLRQCSAAGLRPGHPTLHNSTHTQYYREGCLDACNLMGSCMLSEGSYWCQCFPGYTGPTCLLKDPVVVEYEDRRKKRRAASSSLGRKLSVVPNYIGKLLWPREDVQLPSFRVVGTCLFGWCLGPSASTIRA